MSKGRRPVRGQVSSGGTRDRLTKAFAHVSMNLRHFIRRLAWPHSSPLPRTRSRPLARPSRASGSAEFLSLLSQAAIVSSLRRAPRWDAWAYFGCPPSVYATLVQGFNARTFLRRNLSPMSPLNYFYQTTGQSVCGRGAFFRGRRTVIGPRRPQFVRSFTG